MPGRRRNSRLLAETLVKQRERAGLTRDELADRLGVTRQAVHKWEAGRSLPKPRHLPALAGLLATPLYRLQWERELALAARQEKRREAPA